MNVKFQIIRPSAQDLCDGNSQSVIRPTITGSFESKPQTSFAIFGCPADDPRVEAHNFAKAKNGLYSQ